MKKLLFKIFKMMSLILHQAIGGFFGVRALRILIHFTPDKSIIPVLLRKGGAQVGLCPSFSGMELMNSDKGFSNLIIGNNVHIGEGVLFDLADQVIIEDEVVISPRVQIYTHQDVGNRILQKKFPRKQKPVVIHKGAYIGAGAIILCGSDIGNETVLGAGSLLKNSAQSHFVYAGIPAKKV